MMIIFGDTLMGEYSLSHVDRLISTMGDENHSNGYH